jgi:hypothetical protein
VGASLQVVIGHPGKEKLTKGTLLERHGKDIFYTRKAGVGKRGQPTLAPPFKIRDSCLAWQIPCAVDRRHNMKIGRDMFRLCTWVVGKEPEAPASQKRVIKGLYKKTIISISEGEGASATVQVHDAAGRPGA